MVCIYPNRPYRPIRKTVAVTIMMMLYTGSRLALPDNLVYMPTHLLQGLEDQRVINVFAAKIRKTYLALAFSATLELRCMQAWFWLHDGTKQRQSTGKAPQAKHSRQSTEGQSTGKAQAEHSRQSTAGQSTGKAQAKHGQSTVGKAQQAEHSRQRAAVKAQQAKATCSILPTL